MAFRALSEGRRRTKGRSCETPAKARAARAPAARRERLPGASSFANLRAAGSPSSLRKRRAVGKPHRSTELVLLCSERPHL